MLRDLDGMEVTLATDKMPMRRALAWQAAGAIDLAKEAKWLPDTFDEATVNQKVSICLPIINMDMMFDALAAMHALCCLHIMLLAHYNLRICVLRSNNVRWWQLLYLNRPTLVQLSLTSSLHAGMPAICSSTVLLFQGLSPMKPSPS
jgi:hypothetical protein